MIWKYKLKILVRRIYSIDDASGISYIYLMQAQFLESNLFSVKKNPFIQKYI